MKKENPFSTILKKNWKENRWLHIGLLIVLPIIIYIQSIQFDYTNFDDNGIILQKFEIVGNIKMIDTAFKTDAFFNKSGDFYRPVQNISFMLDAQVSREKLWMFHITNLMIHILTCICLYFFLQLLNLKRETAFLMALLFAVHPLFASGVAWVPSRGDILIGLEGLLLFITFHHYFKGRKIIFFFLHIFLFLITLFTKETSILFPLLFVYYYLLVLKEPAGFYNIKEDIVKLLPFFICWIVTILFFFFMRKTVVAASGANSDVLGIIPFFKNNTVIPTILGKFFIPQRLSTFPLYDNVSTIIGIGFLIAILYLTVKYTATKKWAVLMGFLWFLLFAAPPTIYRLENADTFFNYLEHRTYLPMIGIVFMVAFYLDDKLASAVFKKRFLLTYTPIASLFAVMAFIHCRDYKDTFAIRNRAARLNNPSALAGRAGEYLSKGDTLLAMEDINKAIALNSKDAGMYFERGKIMARLKNHEAADQDFSMALSMQPMLVEVLLARSVERRLLKKYESAFRDIFQAASIDSANPKIYNTFGNLFLEVSNYSEALTSYTKAISLQPGYAEAYNNRAYAKILLQDYAGAISDAGKALELMDKKPSPIAFNNLGHAYAAISRYDSAFIYFNRAIEADHNFAAGFFERGKARLQSKDTGAACKDFQQARLLGYPDTLRLLDKFCK
jgi:tetratricopeptide (TPR) repeat protein